MDILSQQIVRNTPEMDLGLFAVTVIGIGAVLIGSYWLYEIFSKKEKFNIGAIVLVVFGGMFVWFIVWHYVTENYKYEELKVIVNDWNIVHEEGWEIVNQDGKIVTLKRKLEE